MPPSSHLPAVLSALWLLAGPMLPAQHRPPLEGPLPWIALTASATFLNAAAASPYMELSDTRVMPSPEVTAIRRAADGTVEVDWLCFPAAAEIRLEMNVDPKLDPAAWTEVGQGEFASITGTVSAPTPEAAAFFRFVAPLE